MAELIILGSSSAIPDEYHDNAHMVLAGRERVVLIDCVNNQLVRLKKVGINHQRLTDLVLTHFHPDHVSGVPTLLMNLWLMGRQQPLELYGLSDTLDRVVGMMELFQWDTWPNFYPVILHRIPENELEILVECTEFRVQASPVCHLIPTIGLRIEGRESGKVIVYSCDTEPCQQVIRLAEGADVLIHEATGAHLGHSTAFQAGEIARQAGVRVLFLIHYENNLTDPRVLIEQAKQVFGGEVALAEDYMRLKL
jgi:ribonuclease Z